jgi:hypothetical protein
VARVTCYPCHPRDALTFDFLATPSKSRDDALLPIFRHHRFDVAPGIRADGLWR